MKTIERKYDGILLFSKIYFPVYLLAVTGLVIRINRIVIFILCFAALIFFICLQTSFYASIKRYLKANFKEFHDIAYGGLQSDDFLDINSYFITYGKIMPGIFTSTYEIQDLDVFEREKILRIRQIAKYETVIGIMVFISAFISFIMAVF